MKRFIPFLFLLAFSFSCQHEESPSPTLGKATFSLSPKIRGNGRVKETIAPAFVLLNIKDSNDQTQENIKLPLYALGQSYLSENLDLHTGTYQLTHFVVLDASNKVIYATPLGGSDLAKYVTHPLPMDFTIEENQNTQIIPQVLAVSSEDTPESFGLASFGFELVEPKLKTMYTYNHSDNPIPSEKFNFFYDENERLISYDLYVPGNPSNEDQYHLHSSIEYRVEGSNLFYTVSTQSVENGIPGPVTSREKVYLDANSNVVRYLYYMADGEVITDIIYSHFVGGYEIKMRRKLYQHEGRFGVTKLSYETDGDGNVTRERIYSTHFEDAGEVEEKLEVEYLYTHGSKINPLYKLPPYFRSVPSFGRYTGAESKNITLKITQVGCDGCGEISYAYKYQNGYVTEVSPAGYLLNKRTFEYY